VFETTCTRNSDINNKRLMDGFDYSKRVYDMRQACTFDVNFNSVIIELLTQYICKLKCGNFAPYDGIETEHLSYAHL